MAARCIFWFGVSGRSGILLSWVSGTFVKLDGRVDRSPAWLSSEKFWLTLRVRAVRYSYSWECEL